jgi:AcrR family transcriptional regulator
MAECDWRCYSSPVAAETRAQSTSRLGSARSHELRERKRTRTRLMIQAEALRLFADQGYERTTVEEIADAAAISPRTFFRYFPSKEDVVLWDEYDPQVGELLAARPDDEPVAESFCAIIRETLGGLLHRDPDQLLTRVRLLSSVPELRARFLETQANWLSSSEGQDAEMIAAAFAHRSYAPDFRQLRATVGALGAAVTIAIDEWQREGGKSDLLGLFDQTVDALVTGIGELQQRTPPRRVSSGGPMSRSPAPSHRRAQPG